MGQRDTVPVSSAPETSRKADRANLFLRPEPPLPSPNLHRPDPLHFPLQPWQLGMRRRQFGEKAGQSESVKLGIYVGQQQPRRDPGRPAQTTGHVNFLPGTLLQTEIGLTRCKQRMAAYSNRYTRQPSHGPCSLRRAPAVSPLFGPFAFRPNRCSRESAAIR